MPDGIECTSLDLSFKWRVLPCSPSEGGKVGGEVDFPPLKYLTLTPYHGIRTSARSPRSRHLSTKTSVGEFEMKGGMLQTERGGERVLPKLRRVFPSPSAGCVRCPTMCGPLSHVAKLGGFHQRAYVGDPVLFRDVSVPTAVPSSCSANGGTHPKKLVA